MLLVDDYTRMTAVCFLKNKSEAFENFKIYKEMVENEMDSRIKCLRSDNGGEFTSKEFMDYCNNHGIKRQFSIARTPQQNGVVERKNRTEQEMALTMIMDSNLTEIFWTQAVHIAVHIQNRVILRNNTDKTPYELWKGRPTNVSTKEFLEANATSKEKMVEWESLTLVWTNEYLLVTQVQGKHTIVTI